MPRPMDLYDLAELQEQDEFVASGYSFTFWRRQWENYKDTHQRSWYTIRLDEAVRNDVPKESGVYTLVLKPGIANHPACAYLMYVGRAKSLRRRFGEYLSEELRRSPKRRPKIFRAIRKYSDHLYFCFTRVPVDDIAATEDALINAYIPPLNDRFSAEVSKIVGAFR